MNRQNEWEVVDSSPHQRRPRVGDLLQVLLGPHWRWKIAGFAILATAAITLGVLIAGVFFVGVVTAAVALLVYLQCRKLLERARQAFRSQGRQGGIIHPQSGSETEQPLQGRHTQRQDSWK